MKTLVDRVRIAHERVQRLDAKLEVVQAENEKLRAQLIAELRQRVTEMLEDQCPK